MLPKRIQNNRILVRPDDPETKTPGGLIIPDMSVNKPNKGTVVLSGKQSEDDLKVDVDDKVFYLRDAGIKITIDNQEYLLMKKGELLYIE